MTSLLHRLCPEMATYYWSLGDDPLARRAANVPHTGGGDYLYEIVEEWGEMPNKWTYDIAGVAVDSKGNVYMFNRGNTRRHPR